MIGELASFVGKNAAVIIVSIIFFTKGNISMFITNTRFDPRNRSEYVLFVFFDLYWDSVVLLLHLMFTELQSHIGPRLLLFTLGSICYYRFTIVGANTCSISTESLFLIKQLPAWPSIETLVHDVNEVETPYLSVQDKFMTPLLSSLVLESFVHGHAFGNSHLSNFKGRASHSFGRERKLGSPDNFWAFSIPLALFLA